MKKFLSLIMALLMMLSLVACGDNAEKTDTDADEEVEEEESSDKKDENKGEDAEEKTTEAETTTEVDIETVIAEKLELNKDELLELFDATDDEEVEFSINAKGNTLVFGVKNLTLENVTDEMKTEIQMGFYFSRGEFVEIIKTIKKDYIPEVECLTMIIYDKNDNIIVSLDVDENTAEKFSVQEYVDLFGSIYEKESQDSDVEVEVFAENNGFVMQFKVNTSDLTDEQKANIQNSLLEDEASDNVWGNMFEEMREMVDVEFFKIVYCDANGEVIAELVIR